MIPVDDLRERYPDLLADADPATRRMVDALHRVHSAGAPPHLRSTVARLACEQQSAAPDRDPAGRGELARESLPVRIAYLAALRQRRWSTYAAPLIAAGVLLLLLALRLSGYEDVKGRTPVIASLLTTTATSSPVTTFAARQAPATVSRQATAFVGAQPAGSSLVQANTPRSLVTCTADVSRWSWARSAPKGYASGLARGNDPTVYLASSLPDPTQFWTVLSSCSAGAFRGHRVRITAEIKVSGVSGWVGLWMRVDGASHPLAFDNMQDRPITGSRGWQRYSVVLDVAPASKDVYFGMLLAGKGEAWIRQATLSIAGAGVPTTGAGLIYPLARSRNLDFAQGSPAW